MYGNRLPIEIRGKTLQGGSQRWTKATIPFLPPPQPSSLLFISIVSSFLHPPPLRPFVPSSSLPPFLPPHLVFTGLKKACQLALRAHECTIHICAPNVDLCSGVVVKEVTCFHLSAVPLMEQPAQVVVLLHAQLTREHMCHTHITSHHITC